MPCLSCAGFHAPPLLRRAASKDAKFFRRIALLFPLVTLFGYLSAAGQTIPGTTAVGGSATPVTVTVTVAQAGNAAMPAVLSGGIAGTEFTQSLNNGTGYCSQLTYAANDHCKVDVVFSPRFPGLRRGAVVLRDSGTMQVLGTAQISAVATGALPVLYPGQTSTVAGSRDFLYVSSGDDGIAAVKAPIQLPKGIALDAAGNLYIADYLNYRIRKVTANASGMLDDSSVITTVAGNGSPGYTPDGVQATSASIASPTGLVVDGAGNLYFADTNNDVVRKVDTNGIITTVAGQPRVVGSMDGFAATATLDHPEGVALDLDGNLLIADTHNNSIRVVSIQSATPAVTTLSTGTLVSPSQILVRADGSLLISSTGSDQILAFRSGTLSVFAGSNGRGFNGDGGPATSALLSQPVGIAEDPAGNVYIADQGNNRVRMVDKATGKIITVAGNGNEGFAGDCNTDNTAPPNLCGPQNLAGFDGPWSVQFSAMGELFLSDPFHNRVRRFSGLSVLARYATIRNLKTSPPQTITLRNYGNAPLTLTAPACDQTRLEAAPPACAFPAGTATTLAPLDSLAIALDYTPSVPLSGPFPYNGTGSLRFTFDSTTPVQSPPIIYAQAQVLDVNPTTTTLASASNPGLVNTPIHFLATVSNGNAGSFSGTVTFSADGNVMCAAVPLAGVSAGCDITFNTIGHHSVIAKYSGDPQDAESSSAPVDELIKLALGSSNLTASPNPQAAGQAVTLTYTAVAPGGGPVPTGTVVFSDNTGWSSLAVPLFNGVAEYTTTTLGVGHDPLVATYSGDTTYMPGTATATETIQAGTSIVGASVNPIALAGTPVHLTATVTPDVAGNVPISGDVTFLEGSTRIGSAALNAQGQANFTTTSLPAGTHILTANYQGNQVYTSSTSLPFQQQVNKAVPQLSLSGPTSAVNVTTLASFVSILSSPGVAPTGTLTLYDGATPLATQQVSSAGRLTLATTSLSVGQHSITVTYSGDANTEAATSAAVTVTIQLAPSTALLASNANPAVLGTPVTFTATVASATGGLSGTVQFLDGSRVLGSAPLRSAVATLTTEDLPFGLHAISAVYLGDGGHASATSPSLQQRIVYQARLSLAAAPNPAYTGQDVSLVASIAPVNSLVPSGTITFHDGGVTLGTAVLNAGTAVLHVSTLSVGSHAIIASYGGNTDFSTAEGGTNLVIQNSLTQTSGQVDTNPATYGVNLTLSAAVTSTGGAATGSLRFTEGGTTIGTATLDSGGHASFRTASLAPGSHTVVAQYLGDGRASPSNSSPITFLVKQRVTLALTSDSNPSLSLDGIDLHASLGFNNAFAASGTVIFYEGETRLGTAQLAGNGVATITIPALPVGAHMITANYSGDTSDFAADAPPFSQVVAIRSTTTGLSSFASNSKDPQQITYLGIVQSPTPSRVAGPTGTVSFYRGKSLVTTAQLDANGVARVTLELEAGTPATLTAVYSGDANYAPSTSDPSTAKPGPATQFVLSVSNSNIKLGSGQRQTVTVTVASVSGFSDDMRLGCVGLPYAATCTFSKTGMQLTANGSASMNLIVDTGDPLGAGSTASVTPLNLSRHSRAVLCGIPLAGLLLLGMRRRHGVKLLVLLLATGALVGTTGCGGLKINGTPSGNYVFQVTAIGQGTGAQQAVTVKLAVGE